MLDVKIHAYLDYLFSAVLLAAPTVLGLSYDASVACYISAGLHAVLSAVTQYPLGIVKWVPFKVHGMIELGGAIALLAMPWLVNFSSEIAGRNFFLVSGVLLFGVWLATNYGGTRIFASTGVVDEVHIRRAS